MAFIGENQVRNMFIVGSSSNTTITTVKAGAVGNGAIIQSDGTAAAANEEFAVVVKNYKSEITLSDIINPKRVSYAKSIAYKARTLKKDTISDIVAEANKLYVIRITIAGYGSLSVEDEYVKQASYKSKAGDTDEDIIDGLIKSLARNFSRDNISTGTTFSYTTKNGDVLQLPENACFTFAKVKTGGTAEVSTMVMGAASTAGEISVVLNGVKIYIPVSIGNATAVGAEVAAFIDALDGYSASATTGTVTITASDNNAEIDIKDFDGGATGVTATLTTTTQGSDGTVQMTITEKSDYLAKYYVTGKKDKLYLDYSVSVGFPTEPRIVSVEGSIGVGSGYQIRNMEYYLLGNRQDTFRGMGYPHNFEQHYDSVLSGTYSLIEIGYWDEGRDDPMKSKKQITIACPSTGVANTLIGQLNTATGLSVPTL